MFSTDIWLSSKYERQYSITPILSHVNIFYGFIMYQ